jgi:hypothetical protein
MNTRPRHTRDLIGLGVLLTGVLLVLAVATAQEVGKPPQASESGHRTSRCLVRPEKGSVSASFEGRSMSFCSSMASILPPREWPISRPGRSTTPNSKR